MSIHTVPSRDFARDVGRAKRLSDKKSFRDSVIAATALEHRFAVVTRKVDDFRVAGLTVVNPWDAA